MIYAEMESESEPVVVTATRIAQHDYKIAGNVTVITQEQIEASNAQNIPDVLQEALGVHVYNFNTVKSSILDIRGFGDTASRNVLVLVNDHKINNVDMSGADLVQIPIEAVERIEIIRGGGTVLYGDNAVGGVVNIITKKGKGNLSGKWGTTYGSYDTQGTDVEASGEARNVSYYFYSKYLDQRGYRQNSDFLGKDFNTRLGYDFSEKIKADLNVGWHEDNQELPGSLTAAQLSSLGREVSVYESDMSYTTDRYIKLALDADPWPEDVYFGNFVVDLYYRNRDVYDEFNGFGAYHTKRVMDTKGISTKYIFNKPVFNKEINFVTGIDYYDTESDILGSGDNVDDLTISKEEMGIYGFLEFETMEHIFVNGGTRYHKADYAFSQRNVAVDQKQSPEEWVSMGGLKYEYAEGSNLHMNVQQTFRFLATDEWYSSANFPFFGIAPGLQLDLKQQTGIQYEMGVKHQFDKAAMLTVTPYMMDLKNEIFFDPVTGANSNYNKTRRFGVEGEGRVDLLHFWEISFLNKLEFFSNYTYQVPQFVNGDSDGKDIPFVPRHQAGAGIVTGFLKNYSFTLNGRYIGARFAINDTLNETSPAKPYYVLDGKVAYELDNFEIFAGIHNMTDALYSSFVAKSTFSSEKSYFPAPERNFLFGMNVKF
ncbi:MAG: hypothetical protein A2Y04_05420 [Omnitrophica WOR_2 bacterium GWC2_45_7]|nr:MAG: hypothetical protein A2Y04_05420 [Omnitrophica WOR_2 bacterium GWC2_45_7]